jgi:hypothetical protein
MSENPERQLLTTSEVAALANVDVSTVSNWRRRFKGSFPGPVSASDVGKRPRFDRQEIVEWLRLNPQVGGKRQSERDPREAFSAIVASYRQSVHAVTDQLRGDFAPDDYAEVVGRLLVLIEEDRRAGAVRPTLSADEIRRALGELGTRGGQTVFVDGSLQSVYEQLTTVTDPLGFYDKVLATGQNRLSNSAELTTPAPLVTFLTALAGPGGGGLVYDPVAGYGTLLMSCIEAGKARSGVGVDLNERAAAIANRRFYFSKVAATVRVGDTLSDDPLPEVRADLVVADPPLGLSMGPTGRRSAAWEFGTPRASNADTAWLQIAISHLAQGGRAVVVTTVGTLFHTDRATASIRNELIRRGSVQAVFTLPARLRTNTAVRLAVWVLTTPDAVDRRTTVLLVDLGADDPEAIEPTGKGIAAFNEWIENPDAPLDASYAVAVPVTDLLAPDATLVPGRWTPAGEGLDADAWTRRVSQAHLAATQAIGTKFKLPGVKVATAQATPQKLTLGEMVEQGFVSIVKGRHVERYEGDAESFPILTVRDARRGTPDAERAMDRTVAGPVSSSQLAHPGDVLVYPDGDRVVARVWQESGWVIGRFMQVVRVADDAFNPYYLAAAINSPSNTRHLIGGISRAHFNLVDFEVVLQSPEAQAAAERVTRRFEELVARLAEASVLADDARAETLNAITSGLVDVSVE